MIGVKPLFSGQSLGDNDIANFDVVWSRLTARNWQRPD